MGQRAGVNSTSKVAGRFQKNRPVSSFVPDDDPDLEPELVPITLAASSADDNRTWYWDGDGYLHEDLHLTRPVRDAGRPLRIVAER